MIISTKTGIVTLTIVVLCAIGVYIYNCTVPDKLKRAPDIGMGAPPSEVDRTASLDYEATSNSNSGLKHLLHQYNSKIDFYGRVIDQNARPLKGAKVSFSILMGGDIQPQFGLQRREEGEVYSADDGRFQISNRKGTSLTVSTIELEGYKESEVSASQSFGYGSGSALHHPDLTRPVDFLLISKDAAELLVEQYKLTFKWDSSPTSVSIGDSGITIVFVPKRSRPAGKLMNFEWSLDISCPQGEILRLPKNSPPIAPLAGYQKVVSYGHLADDTKWIGGLGQERLAFKTKGGEYGGIDLLLYANRDDWATSAYVTLHFNPGGGRNLE